MTKSFLLYLILLGSWTAFSQGKIEWSKDYNLKPTDFKANAPNSDSQQTIYPHSIIEYRLANYQLAFSNLNSSVICSFLPSASWLDKGPHTDKLLGYAQVTWDLNELAARKLRKLFRENRMTLGPKKTEELYNQVIAEITEIQSQYAKETDFGDIPEKQSEWVQKSQQLLEEYAGYCKTCKPPKKKKKRSKN